MALLVSVLSLVLFLCNIVNTVSVTAGCGSLPDTLRPAIGSLAQRIAINHPSQHARGRFAYLHLPNSYDGTKPFPLILAFHGKGQAIRAFEQETSLSNETHNEEFVVVYPEGLDGMWTSDPEAPMRAERNDVAFTEALLDYLTTILPLCIDLSRVYAVGFSNGGGLTGVLSCDFFMSKRFAAFVTASGAFYRPESLKESGLAFCNAARSPVPFMSFHGDSDPVIDYEGVGTPDGATFEVPKLMTAKAMRAGCDANRGNKTVRIAGGKAEKVTWHCPKEVGDDVVVHYKLKGVGHMWPRKGEPGGEGENSKAAAPVDATTIVLKWLKKHQLPAEFLPESTSHVSLSEPIVYAEEQDHTRDEL